MSIHQIDDNLRSSLEVALEPAIGRSFEPNESQQRLISILLNPDNSPIEVPESPGVDPRAVLLGSWGELTGADVDRVREVGRVSTFLLEHYVRAEQTSGSRNCTPFVFSWVNECGTEITGYEIGIEIDRQSNCWLTIHRNISVLRCPATGLRYALYVAELLDTDYQRLLEMAMRNALLPPLLDDTTIDELDRWMEQEHEPEI